MCSSPTSFSDCSVGMWFAFMPSHTLFSCLPGGHHSFPKPDWIEHHLQHEAPRFWGAAGWDPHFLLTVRAMTLHHSHPPWLPSLSSALQMAEKSIASSLTTDYIWIYLRTACKVIVNQSNLNAKYILCSLFPLIRMPFNSWSPSLTYFHTWFHPWEEPY